MAMTQFEKALISELQGIRKELHQLIKENPVAHPLDGLNAMPLDVAVEQEGFAQALAGALNKSEIRRATINSR